METEPAQPVTGLGDCGLTWRGWLDSPPEVRKPRAGGRALLVSYLFPPTGGSGVQRPAKLAKYLPTFGWSIEVVTAGHHRFPWFDPSLLEDVPADCRVHGIAGLEPAALAKRIGSRFEDSIYWRLARMTGWLGLGDGEALWVGPAARAALRRHREQPFDVLISTGPPHFAHRVAIRVARATGLPWVADLRDPLVIDYDRTPMSRREASAMRRVEQAIMRQASLVVTTVPSLTEDLRGRYPGRLPDSIWTVPNGFDRDDLRAALKTAAGARAEANDCVFVAAGAWYGRRELHRVVEPLQRVLERNPLWGGRVRLVMAGTLDGQQRQRWEGQRPAWLTLAGYLDHASAIRLVAGSACAIVAVPDCQTGRLTIPAKTFELLALPTHVLALVPPDSDTEQIVATAGASHVAPLEDSTMVASALEHIIGSHFAGILAANRDWPVLDRYDRRMVAAAFADCLASACGPITWHRVACSQDGVGANGGAS